jgi:hypothetical protein
MSMVGGPVRQQKKVGASNIFTLLYVPLPQEDNQSRIWKSACNTEVFVQTVFREINKSFIVCGIFNPFLPTVSPYVDHLAFLSKITEIWIPNQLLSLLTLKTLKFTVSWRSVTL